MRIENVDRENMRVVATFTSDDLVNLRNSLYRTINDKSSIAIKRLYAEIITASALCQYGNIDDFDFNIIAKNRTNRESKYK